MIIGHTDFLDTLRQLTLAETRTLVGLIGREWKEQLNGNAGTQDRADKETTAFMKDCLQKYSKDT